jgi:hypothetical protein
MSLRIFSPLGALALLAGCGAPESPPPPGNEIECAIGAGAAFSTVCTLELVAGSDTVVLHHPDGGFRRLKRDTAAGTLSPFDGAEPLVMEQAEGAVQFAIGTDRYRIPSAMLAPLTP